MLSGQTIVISRYKSFVLGFCACKCGAEINIRNKRCELATFIKGHSIGGRKGKEHPLYKHGRYVNNYPTIRINGVQKRIHVVIFEQFYQCCMLPWGRVHHIDEDIHNFDISNLEGYTLSSHNKLHRKIEKQRLNNSD